jgi:hypothetical protein
MGGRREESALGGLAPAGGLLGGVLGGETTSERLWPMAHLWAPLAAMLLLASCQPAGWQPRGPSSSSIRWMPTSASSIRPPPTPWCKRLPTGKEPHHLYLAPDEKTLIVANAGSSTLTFIDPTDGKLLRVVTGIVDPYHLRFSPDMQWFVTAANRLHHVDIYRWQGRHGGRAFQARQAHQRAQDAQPSEHRRQEHGGLCVAAGQRRTAGRGPGHADTALEDQGRQAAGRSVPDGRRRTLLVGLTGDRVVEAYDVSGPRPGSSSASPPAKARTPFAPRATSAMCS